MKIFVLVIINLLSWALILSLLYVFKKRIKKEKTKDITLIVISFVNLLFHLSSVLYHLIKDNRLYFETNMYLPVYPCNVSMRMLIFLSLMILIRKKNTKIFKTIAEFTFYLGTFGGFIGLAFNINYLRNPDLANYDILKGLLSHVTLILGSMYLLTMGYMKIRVVSNMISGFVGVVILLISGLYSNWMIKLLNEGECNSMFLLYPPIPEAPYINTFTLMLTGLVLLFLFSYVVESITVPKEERSLYHLTLKKKDEDA